ncbi:MAG: hypothetical protein GY913_15540 [Proteobacteria bacterium]|nr:hypothetical protein [Pseudomonadota bacterium]MCP4918322.1 hypothetical protein [Pseudomonadota bacterium]
MDELVEEQRLGASLGGKDANAACLALSKAARALLLYDAENQLIRDFLGDLRDRIWAFGEMHGPLDLDVRPFELVRDGEVVYNERDRERSLSWRMFRDGIRRLVVRPEVTWEELLSLLEILSIRYTGLRQQEDDIVTLLWRAGFVNIEVHSVEGVISQDEQTTLSKKKQSCWTGPRYQAPADWDQPLPELADRIEVSYRPVTLWEIDELRMEQASSQAVLLGLRLASELIEASLDQHGEGTELSKVLVFLSEFRDHLLEEARLQALLDLLDLIEKAYMPPPPLVVEFGEALVNKHSLAILLRAQRHHVTPSRMLVAFVNRFREPPFEGLVGVLVATEDDAVRRLLRQLIEPMLVGREARFSELAVSLPPRAAADLVRAAGRSIPSHALDIAALLAESRPDQRDLVEEISLLLERSQDGAEVAAALKRLLESSIPNVRLRAIEELTERRERSAYDNLVALAETRGEDMSTEEADKIGIALATLLPEVASEQFESWVAVKEGMIGRLMKGDTRMNLRRVAVSGFGEMPRDARGSRLLHWLSSNSEGDLRRHVAATIVKRRVTLHGR